MNDTTYVLPWVEGPEGFNAPFGLDTRYGHLVPVFLPHSQSFPDFFNYAAGMLKSGFELKQVAVVARSKDDLNVELAANMPQGMRFAVILEGTPQFEQFIQELEDGTIWGDEQ